MAAPVLTPAEQRAALSKRKKKKVLKNLLGLPNYLKVESQTPDELEAEKLKNILERLLPGARLPILNSKPKEAKPEETTLKQNAMLKRRQLSLGVNNLNKSIKKGLISAALFANDVEPKFLIHHLNLLCRHNKIPHLHINLREITKKCLGFPCIALGFKTNSDFSEAISEIKKIYERKGSGIHENSEVSDTEVIEDIDEVREKSGDAKSEPPFVYLYRTSTKERVFIPEDQKTQTDGFISLVKSEDAEPEKPASGISAHLIKKNKIIKPKEDSSSEEDYKIPKKKQKRNGFADKMKIKQKPKYQPVNLVQVSSNPNRIGKRKKV